MTITSQSPNLLDILEKIVSHIKDCDNCYDMTMFFNPRTLSEEVRCCCGRTWKILGHLRRDHSDDCSYSEFISAIKWLNNSASISSIKSGKLVLNRPSPSLLSSPSDIIVEQFEKEPEYVAQNSIEYLEL